MPSIKILSWDDIDAPLPPREYLVEGLGLVAGGGAPHILVGFGGSRKTWAAQALALALSGGTLVWGRYPVTCAKPVMYVDLEQGETLTRERFQKIARGMQIPAPPLRENISLITASSLRGIDLKPPSRPTWELLMRGRALIIIDSFRVAMRGADENDSAIRDGLDFLGELSESTGCRAMLLHHSKKGTPEDDADERFHARGSGAIYDGVDSMYNFYAKGKEPTVVSHTKCRTHGKFIDKFCLMVKDLGDDACIVGADDEEALDEARQEAKDEARDRVEDRNVTRIREALIEAGVAGLSTERLKGRAKLSGSAFAAAMKRLDGLVVTTEQKVGRVVYKVLVWTGGRPDNGRTDCPSGR